MAVHPIVIAGNPVLHNPTRPVERFDDELRTLIDDMYETMAAANGVGLAANQIGIDLRLFVYNCHDDEGNWFKGVVVNPVLTTSEIPEGMPDEDDDIEGCLSAPARPTPPAAPTGPRSPASTATATRSRSRARASSPAASSTRPTTWTASCTWTA